MTIQRIEPLIVASPLPIERQLESLQPLTGALPALDFDIPYMNMTRFSARYISGGTSLREGRNISRKRLSIAMAGIPNDDVLSQSIAKRIEDFELALVISHRHKMSNEVLCDIHALLTPEEEHRGLIRSHQNWVGGKDIESAKIITPPPEKVKTLLEKWQRFVRKEDLTDPATAIIAFSYFIVLHPFADGNGRLSRLLLTSFLLGEKPHKSFLSPALFRLNHFEESREELFATPRAILNGNWRDVIAYWKRAFSWQKVISAEATRHVLESRKSLETALLLAGHPALAASLLDLLFEQPLVTLEYVCKELGVDVLKANSILDSFCLHGILRRCRLKQPLGTIVFSCEQVFELWEVIDNLLFSTAPFATQKSEAVSKEVMVSDT